MFPVALYCAYQLGFVRKNRFTEKKELKLLNRPFEAQVLGTMISSKIEAASIAYKHETEEVQLCKRVTDKIIEANNLKDVLPAMKVRVLHNEHTIALFMNTN